MAGKRKFKVSILGAVFLTLLATLMVLLFAPVPSINGESINYVYDDLNRLTRIEYGDGRVTAYEYDETGNRVQKASHDPLVITATVTGNGSISPSGAVTVPYSSSKTFTIFPDSGYRILDVVVDGVSAGVVYSYTFSNVTTNHAITAAMQILSEMDTLLYAANAGDGIWRWNGTAWSQITAENPQAMIASGSVLYGDFGASGIRRWDGVAWSQITASNPLIMAASGSLLYGTFEAGNGIWRWDGTAWSHITPNNPETMAAFGGGLYGDFGSGGIWRWDGRPGARLRPATRKRWLRRGRFFTETSVPGGSGNGKGRNGVRLPAAMHRVWLLVDRYCMRLSSQGPGFGSGTVRRGVR